MEGLTEEEKKALRASKFAPLPSIHHQPRLAHPGGPIKTNKAAALAKFLERKLQEPNGLASVDTKLVELAVQNAKNAVNSSGTTSTSGRMIHHVKSFDDSEESAEEEIKISSSKKRKKKKKKCRKQKKLKDSTSGETKNAKKKMQL